MARKQKREHDGDAEEQRASKAAKAEETVVDVDADAYADAAEGSTEAKGAGKCDLLITGSTKWSSMGRSCVPKGVAKRGGTDDGDEILGPSRLRFGGGALKGVSFVGVYSGPVAAHIVLIGGDGCAYGMGRNEHGQLGLEEPVALRVPRKLNIPLEDKERVVSAACGRAHTVVVTSEGRAFAAGANTFGQLGGGRKIGDVCGKWVRALLPASERVTCAAAGGNFTVFCAESGRVYSAGNAQYGQLGVGFTGEHIVSAGKVAHSTAYEPAPLRFGGKKVTSVACGVSHTLALDEDGCVWTWGYAAYGRLGHKSTKDELAPRKIETLASTQMKVTKIMAGEKSSFAYIAQRSVTYRWGISKANGEATMYPKMVSDLVGWEVRSFAAGISSTIVAAEKSVISWGGSPTHGELGYGEGEPKSSTKLKKVDAVEDLVTEQVAMGICFSVLLVNVEKDEDRKIVDELPEYEEEEEE